ncbi:MAG: SLBB domain-containing protein [Actinomycetota bacterium]|nr:SLBB domain-containing protein [Actinomycetota bacterium]
MAIVDATGVRAGAGRLLACHVLHGRADLGAHLDVHGHLGRDAARHIADDVHDAGLTGRGGAGFPTALKWDLARHARRPTVVVNAMEGEPASGKDKVLLRHAPHLVLDGAQLVASAVGAGEIVVCVADDDPRGQHSLVDAIAERAPGAFGRADVRLTAPPAGYVSGEESALASYVAGGIARPFFRARKGTVLVARRRAMLVHNAETLAHVALVARHGAAWFRSVGSADAPGTTLVTISGDVAQPGVYEVERGQSVASLLAVAGGAAEPCAVLLGGYGGTWIRPGQLGTPYADRALRAIGASPGAGVVAAVPAAACGLAEVARIARYLAGESAGQCGPCVFGLPAIASDLSIIERGDGGKRALARLAERLDAIAGRGACRHPDGVVRFVRSALDVFATDVANHARGAPCPSQARMPILPLPSRRASEAERQSSALR